MILYRGRSSRRTGANDWTVAGELTLRGVTRPVQLEVHYLRSWSTPWWEGNVDRGPKVRAGSTARATIDRQEFGESWNSKLDNSAAPEPVRGAPRSAAHERTFKQRNNQCAFIAPYCFLCAKDRSFRAGSGRRPRSYQQRGLK